MTKLVKPAKKFQVGQQVICYDKIVFVACVRWHVNRLAQTAYWQYGVYDPATAGCDWYSDFQLLGQK